MTTASIRPDFLTALDDTYTTAITGENLDGHWGNDTIHGNIGDDTLNGGADDDAVYGGDGNDKVSGGYGNDFVDGGTGNDTVIGGYGNDTLNGGDGVDLYYAGDGDDLLIVDFEAAQVGMDSVIGGNGSDTLRLNLTAADYANATILAALQELVTDAADGWGIRGFKGYEALNLFVNKMETIEIYVDGVLTDPFAPVAISAVRIVGADAYDISAWAISSAGDVDGDGLDDILIGATDAERVEGEYDYAGEAYLVYGSALLASGGQIDLAVLTAEQGVLFRGDEASAAAGYSVSRAGDLDGDGLDDVLIGAPFADDGETYLVYGSALGASGGVIDLASLSSDQGVIITGGVQGVVSGAAVANAGDVDGDGVPDIVIGDLGASTAHLVYGAALLGSGGALDLSTLTADQGVRIGTYGNVRLGISVSAAGDIDGDGLDDVIVGAEWANIDAPYRGGEAYVIFGTGLVASGGSLQIVGFGVNPWASIYAGGSLDLLGRSVSAAGDVDGDGLADVIIGAPDADSDGVQWTGETYVIFGSALAADQKIDLATLNATQGVRIKGIDSLDFSGISVSDVGDIDGDGLDEILIGAQAGDPDGRTNAGEAYLIYGSALTSSGGVIDLATLTPEQGVLFMGVEPGSNTGWSVSGAGDVDGDGIADVMIGTVYGGIDDKDQAGETYVLSGALLLAEKLDDGVIDLGDAGLFV